jgi:hypothetical protein
LLLLVLLLLNVRHIPTYSRKQRSHLLPRRCARGSPTSLLHTLALNHDASDGLKSRFQRHLIAVFLLLHSK